MKSEAVWVVWTPRQGAEQPQEMKECSLTCCYLSWVSALRHQAVGLCCRCVLALHSHHRAAATALAALCYEPQAGALPCVS